MNRRNYTITSVGRPGGDSRPQLVAPDGVSRLFVNLETVRRLGRLTFRFTISIICFRA